MGYEKQKALEKRDKKKAKAAAPPWQTTLSSAETVAWSEVEHYLISYVVQSVALAGGSAQFKVTSDRGAVGIHIYHDSHEAKTAWFSELTELNEAMYAAGDYYRSLAGEEPLRWD